MTTTATETHNGKMTDSGLATLPVYPFTAIVGQAELKLALLLCVIDPTIGGVMVMGHRGTAKSTAVRALARYCRRNAPSPGALTGATRLRRRRSARTARRLTSALRRMVRKSDAAVQNASPRSCARCRSSICRSARPKIG